MTKLEDVFDLDLFHQMREEGYIRVQTLDNSTLALANYSEKAQFDRVWNDVTTQCRGLVYDTVTLEVVTRCLKKFHNHNEPEAEHLDLNAPVFVSDKVDGSMICLSLYKD